MSLGLYNVCDRIAFEIMSSAKLVFKVCLNAEIKYLLNLDLGQSEQCSLVACLSKIT